MAKKITWEDKEHILPYGTRENQVWDLDMNEIKTVVNANADSLAGLEGGYQGVLLIADTPTIDGYYLAGESGTYTNAGGLVVDLTDTITFINVSETQTVFTKTEIPLNTVTLTQSVTSGNTTEAVSSDAVYNLDEVKIIRNHKPTSYKNLYDKYAVQYNKYINPANGLIQTLTNAIVSDFIPVIDINQDVITSIVDLGLTSFRTITFLSGDKVTSLGRSYYNAGIIANVNCNVEWFENGWKINAYPVGTQYCVFQVRKNVTTTTWETAEIQFENGLIRTSYDDRSPFANTVEYRATKSTVDSVVTPFERTSFKNLYYSSNVQLDKYINASNGLIQTLANGIVTDFIPIDDSKSYVFTSDVQTILNINFKSVTFLGSDKSTVLGYGYYSGGALVQNNFVGEYYLNGIRVTTCPVGAEYVVFQIRENNAANLIWETALIQIEEGTERTVFDDKSSFMPYERSTNLESRDYGNWFLKRYASFGDSITWLDGNGKVGYQQQIIKRNGILDYKNKGVSGETMTFYTGSTNDFVSDAATYDFSLYDIITIAHGTNDFGLNIPIGTLNDAVNNTFYGAYNLALTEIFTQNQNIRIVLLTPFQRTGQNSETSPNNSAGHNLKDYVDAIKIIGSKWSCPVVDCFSNSGWNSLTLPIYTYDGLHGSDLGYEFAGKYIANQINTI